MMTLVSLSSLLLLPPDDYFGCHLLFLQADHIRVLLEKFILESHKVSVRIREKLFHEIYTGKFITLEPLCFLHFFCLNCISRMMLNSFEQLKIMMVRKEVSCPLKEETSSESSRRRTFPRVSNIINQLYFSCSSLRKGW